MTQAIKQSTSITMRIGPFIDETDGKTPETALIIVQADFQISKGGGAFAQKNDSGGGTHDADGWYSFTLNATDTNTLGLLTVQVHVAGALPVWKDFMIVPANVWDSLYGADRLQVDVQEIGASALSSIRWTGDGSIQVNHNTGGADNMKYETAGAVGIDNAVVRAYLASDWDAGNKSESFVKAKITTDVNGRWSNSMFLDAGSYTFVFEKQMAYGPDEKDQAVS